MVIDKLQLSGSELKSNDALGGVTMRSENEDVEITAGRQVSMHGKSVNVLAEQDIQMVGRSVELRSSGFNTNVELHTTGGALTIDKLAMSGGQHHHQMA